MTFVFRAILKSGLIIFTTYSIQFFYFMKKRTFVVTGGTGFIGSKISELLVRKNFNVKIYDDNSRGSISQIKNFKKKNKIY